jgi:hypothetical protein
MLGDCEDEVLYNDFAFGSQRGVTFIKKKTGASGISMGLGIDGSTRSISFEGMSQKGFDFINTQLVAIGSGEGTRYIETKPGFNSQANFYSSDYWGSVGYAISADKGSLNFVLANFQNPGDFGFANLDKGLVNVKSSAFNSANTLVNGKAAGNLSIQSSVVDSYGADTSKYAVWKNNLGYLPLAGAAFGAINKSGWTATASIGSGTAAKALDGDFSSKWNPAVNMTNGQWFIVDMKSPLTFNKITLDTYLETSDTKKGYSVFISNDGKNWGKPVAAGSQTNSQMEIKFAKKTARYIKVVQSGTAKARAWGIYEFDVYSADKAANPAQAAKFSLPPVPVTVPGQVLPDGEFIRKEWTASASSNNAAASNILDGNAATKWNLDTTQTKDQWVVVDMKLASKFNRIILDTTGSPKDFQGQYKVFVSNDGRSWGSAIAESKGNGDVTEIKFPMQSARYLKVQQTADSNTNWGISELNVYGMVNRGAWKASASQSNEKAANAFDGSYATRWDTGVVQSSGQWFMLNMGAQRNISKITLDATGSIGDYPRGYEVYVSEDGAKWGDPVAKGKGTNAITEITFTPCKAQYIKIVQTGSDPGLYWSIHELSVD